MQQHHVVNRYSATSPSERVWKHEKGLVCSSSDPQRKNSPTGGNEPTAFTSPGMPIKMALSYLTVQKIENHGISAREEPSAKYKDKPMAGGFRSEILGLTIKMTSCYGAAWKLENPTISARENSPAKYKGKPMAGGFRSELLGMTIRMTPCYGAAWKLENPTISAREEPSAKYEDKPMTGRFESEIPDLTIKMALSYLTVQ